MRQILTEDDPHIGEEPQAGWFKRRLVDGGPFVSARIWVEQLTDESGDLIADEVLKCEVNGKPADIDKQWSRLCGNPISEADFNFMTADLTWVKDYSPDEPKANPYQKIDWQKVPVPTFGKKEPAP